MYVENRNDRYWALAAHLSIVLIPFLGPIVILILRANSQFVRQHALQALLFHLVFVVLMTISGWLVFLLIGFPMLLVFGLMGIYGTVRASVSALSERSCKYPITGNWI
ncbi:DUF4870 domain-containing protein [Tumebacillus permanentifrigoris]|uniref:Uncharacterized protein DUF4870 n=1 Tax=Tumebacillus permanentifrigoris TaxID=378543 RepID=A0A316D8H2_9BACL|nr:DUF4870 domain-containing protein [Tumebacillus permanentifrigoris]PWK11223.1 uncharacterized protein DUF4870 [Tumebacillus permanentifrigoris]